MAKRRSTAPEHVFLCGSLRCPRCSKMVTEREKAATATAFTSAIEECEAYSASTTSEEAKAVALNIATRIKRKAKRPT